MKGKAWVQCLITLDLSRWWHVSIFDYVSLFQQVQYTKSIKPKSDPNIET